MRPSSRLAGLDGRAHPRTTPGRAYQVHPRTTRRPWRLDARSSVPGPWTAAPRCTAAPADLPYACVMLPRTLAALLLGVLIAASGCGGAPAPSFDPTGVCSADGSAPGAYPDLEALIPTTYEARAPETLDSGRNCTPQNLGSLLDAGVSEVRFAGGTWGFGGNRAAALVVFQAPGLEATDIATFYMESARTANRTQITGASTLELAGRPGHRLDTKTGERLQTVMVWPSAVKDTVNVVITNDLPDPKILAAVDAFGGG